MNKLYTLPSPAVFGHRGASKIAPENTMAAFQLALEQKAHGIELDAMLTKDEKVVVIHDQNIERTTNGNGLVNEMTAHELLQYDAGSFFSDDFRNQNIPLLEEVLEEFKHSMVINIEMKNYHAPFDNLPYKIAEIIKRQQCLDSVLFSSFHPVGLIRIKKIFPHCSTALLSDQGFTGIIARSKVGEWIAKDIIHPHYSTVTTRFMNEQKKKKRRVHVWTVNKKEDILRMKEMGVDGIISDDPALVRSVLEED